MPDRLVTIGAYSTPFEASLVRGRLEAFDIDATLVDAETVSVNWLWSNLLGGIKVQVPESDVEEALHLLSSEWSDEPDLQDAAETAICPNCGSPATEYLLDKRGSFLTLLLLGFPLLPAVSKRECADCGHRWKS